MPTLGNKKFPYTKKGKAAYKAAKKGKVAKKAAKKRSKMNESIKNRLVGLMVEMRIKSATSRAASKIKWSAQPASTRGNPQNSLLSKSANNPIKSFQLHLLHLPSLLQLHLLHLPSLLQLHLK